MFYQLNSVVSNIQEGTACSFALLLTHSSIFCVHRVDARSFFISIFRLSVIKWFPDLSAIIY